MNAIEAHSVSKIYRIYANPKDRIKELLFKKPLHVAFAALNNVSFSVNRGETFGIIGENGAGKSTMLKILAATLNPTSGSVKVRGRVAALLELGAGFHPDFTGEENIYMNAALLGLSRKEVEAKFDQIVSFSELGDFIWRPVRIYSSGMYVRLAFSIATSVDPDILVVDEALSVGDLYFQKKSIERLMGFRKAGKTIIFCTHNLYQVKLLCNRAIWLKNGNVASIGDVDRTVSNYESYLMAKELPSDEVKGDDPKPKENNYGRELRLDFIRVVDEAGKEKNRFRTFEDLYVDITLQGLSPSVSCHLGLVISRPDHIHCFATSTQMDKLPPFTLKQGEKRVMRFKLPGMRLLAGEYLLCVYVLDEHGVRIHDLVEYVSPFFVSHSGAEMGISYMDHQWEEVT